MAKNIEYNQYSWIYSINCLAVLPNNRSPNTVYYRNIFLSLKLLTFSHLIVNCSFFNVSCSFYTLLIAYQSNPSKILSGDCPPSKSIRSGDSINSFIRTRKLTESRPSIIL